MIDKQAVNDKIKLRWGEREREREREKEKESKNWKYLLVNSQQQLFLADRSTNK